MASAVLQVKSALRKKNEILGDLGTIVEESTKKKCGWGLLQHDILFAATFWFMMECGFSALDANEGEAILPKNWKHGTKNIYEAEFVLPPHDDHLVRLVALPADDVLCINVLVSSELTRSVNLRSLAVSSSELVPRPEANSIALKFSNLELFRLHLRSAVIWPIRCSILTNKGIVNGSLSGLSDEIKLKIFRLLDIHDLLAVSETCHDLNRVCDDQGLWKTLFHKQFRRYCKCAGSTKNCEELGAQWKENYKHHYKLKVISKMSHHSSFDSFHTAPESNDYEVDLTFD